VVVPTLARDGRRLLGGLRRTLGYALRPDGATADVAVLEGGAVARVGASSGYRVRVHNPDAEERRLAVRIRGWREDGTDGAFDLCWDVALPPGASAERWVQTRWRGDAVLVATPPADADLRRGHATAGRWALEAVADGAGAGRGLRIGGVLLA
jgi:hypothetical protein